MINDLQEPHHVSIIPGLPGAGWSSLVARRAHNPKVVGSNPAPATKRYKTPLWGFRFSRELNWAVGPFFLGDYGC